MFMFVCVCACVQRTFVLTRTTATLFYTLSSESTFCNAYGFACARAIQIHIDTINRQNRSRIRLQFVNVYHFVCWRLRKKRHVAHIHCHARRECEWTGKERKKKNRRKNDGLQRLTRKIFHATYIIHYTRRPNTCWNAWITTIYCVARYLFFSFVRSVFQLLNLFLILIFLFSFDVVRSVRMRSHICFVHFFTCMYCLRLVSMSTHSYLYLLYRGRESL